MHFTVELLVASALLIPAAVVMVLYPPPFDMSVAGGAVEYEFADPGYAEAFAALNGATTDRARR